MRWMGVAGFYSCACINCGIFVSMALVGAVQERVSGVL